MHRFLLLLLLTLAPAAHAQTAPAPAPATLTPAAPALTASQAQTVLDVLRDDKRRAEFTTVLEGMARGLPAAAPAPAEPATTLPLAPDSLAEQLLVQLSAAVSNAGAQLVASVQAVNDLPLLWRWLSSQATDPEARARIGDTAWKLAVVLAMALAVEWLAVRVLRRLRATLGGSAPRPAPEPAPMADTEAAHRSHRLALTMGALRRLPYLLGRLLLDLLPIAVFAAVAYLLIGTRLGDEAIPRQALTLVVRAYIATRVLLALVWVLVQPGARQLRLLNVSDRAAAFLTRWAWRVTVIAMSGYVLAEVGLLFGMYRTAYNAILKLFALVVHGCLVTMVLQARLPVARRIRAAGVQTGPWAALRSRLADVWHLVAIFYIVALWLVWAAELRNGYVRLMQFFAVTTLVLLAARLLAMVVLGGLDRLRAAPVLHDSLPGLEGRISYYYPILRAVLLGAITLLTGFALLEAWGLGAWSWLMRNGLGGRVVSAVLLIGFTVLVAVVVWEGANAAIEAHLARLAADAHLARAGRLRTLLPMLRAALLVAIVLVVALTTLSEIGVNIAPLLAGAGVVGIAVGFGSQRLVQDLITGLFLLLENTMQVGDVVTLGGLTGTVEALSIRTIRLRALDGSVHIVPFSAVSTVTNQTRDYGYAVLDISVGLNEEPGRVTEVVRGIAAAMRADPQWATKVLEPLDVMGVERFVDTAWVLRVRMKTQPASRWAVGRELNRRVKLGFDEHAIESPITSYKALSAPEHDAPAQEKAA